MTICVEPRRAVFVSLDVVDSVRLQLLHAAADHRFAVFVYCFTDDHLHILLVGESEDSDLNRFVCRFKQRAGFRFTQATGGRLWEPGYYERILRDEESTVDVARYILENPVRAGLAKSAIDYPFSGSSVAPLTDIIGDVQLAKR